MAVWRNGRSCPKSCWDAVMAAADGRLKPKEVARRAQEMAPGWSAKELYELLTRA